MQRFYIGVDIGGTKVAVGLISPEGQLICRTQEKTMADEGAAMVLERIQNQIVQTAAQGGLRPQDAAGIGIACPGPLIPSQGVVVHAPMLGWRNVPLRKIIADAFGVPCLLENDANAAAYGELALGAGRGCRDMIYITVSTGVGGGVITNGRLLYGKHEAAGEIGHICVEWNGRPCGCGNRGCLETYASGTAIAQITRERLAQQPQHSLWAEAGQLDNVDAALVAQYARAGDPLCALVWQEAAQRLGQGIGTLVQLFDTERIVIGGGAASQWDLWEAPMTAAAKSCSHKLMGDDLSVVPAQLEGNVGLLGAGLLARDTLGG